LPDCRGRLDIDDDRVLDVDQVVRRIGEEGLAAVRSRPARRRVGGRNELRGNLSRGSESGIVEDCQILIDCSASGFRWKSLVAFDPLEKRQVLPDLLKVDKPIDRPEQVVDWDMPLE
jgi:hypothetical protein